MLGGFSCILFGDFGQLSPVMDLPLHTTISRNELSDLGSTTYHCFSKVVLDQIMQQHGDSPDLLLLRNAETSLHDWE